MVRIYSLLLLVVVPVLFHLSLGKPSTPLNGGKSVSDVLSSDKEEAAKRIKELLLDILEDKMMDEKAATKESDKRLGPWDLVPTEEGEGGAKKSVEGFGPWKLKEPSNGGGRSVEEPSNGDGGGRSVEEPSNGDGGGRSVEEPAERFGPWILNVDSDNNNQEKPSKGGGRSVNELPEEDRSSNEEKGEDRRIGPWLLSNSEPHSEPPSGADGQREAALQARVLSDDTLLNQLTVGDLKALVRQSVQQLISGMQKRRR